MNHNENLETPEGMRSRSFAAWILLLLILSISAPLRTYRLADSIGGFQAYAEAESMMAVESPQATRQLQTDVSAKPSTTVFLPGYPLLVHAFRWLPLPLFLVARLIVLIAGLAGILLVFDLARRLFNPGIGAVAAALFAFAPIGALLGRNAQPEMLALVLLLLAHWILLRSNPDPDQPVSKGIRQAGLAWAMAALVHPFVLLSLPAWLASECWRKGSMAPLKNRSLWILSGLTLVPGLAFYGYHAVRDFSGFTLAVTGGTPEPVPTISKLAFGELPAEAWWAYSPLISLCFIAGLIWSTRQSKWPVRHLLLHTGSYLLVALLFFQRNVHLVWLLPFASILAASLLWRISWRWLAWSLILLVSAQGALLSLLMLCHLKYGFTELTQLLNYYKSTCNRCIVLVRSGFLDSKLAELEYYFGADRIVNLDRAEVTANHQVRIDSLNDRIYLYHITSEMGSGGDFDVSRVLYSPVLFGVQIQSGNPNYYRLNPGQWTFEKKYPWTYFSVQEVGLKPSIAMIWISRSTGVFREGDSISFK